MNLVTVKWKGLNSIWFNSNIKDIALLQIFNFSCLSLSLANEREV